jgi:hypothetical protein
VVTPRTVPKPRYGKARRRHGNSTRVPVQKTKTIIG